MKIVDCPHFAGSAVASASGTPTGGYEGSAMALASSARAAGHAVTKRVAPMPTPRLQQTQWRRSGSSQMGGVWNTNRFFVRRQFG